MKFNGFVGPTYKLNSVNVDCQRCVNLIVEKIESGTGKEASTIYYKSSEGLQKIAEVGTGPIRLVHKDYSGQIIVVSGTEVYKLIKTFAGTESIFPVKLGNIGLSEPLPAPLPDFTRQVRAISGTGGLYGYWTIIVDNSYQNYYYSHDSLYISETFGEFASFSYPPVGFATQVEYSDGYAIYIVPGENKFYVSDWNSPIVSALSFATSEGNPDKINAIQVLNRLVYIFNEKSIEVYSNTGNADFPFERVSGGYISIGNLADYSPARNSKAIFWLGRDENGQGTVYAMSSLSPERISTHAIEQAISKYANPEKAVGYCYSREGHDFYVLNFAEASWCYDLSTGMWHERAYTSTITGELERHRTNNVVFRGARPDITSSYYNSYFCGDYASNKIYLLKQGFFTEDDSVLTRMRRSPHMSAAGKLVFYNTFTLDIETGVGLDGAGLGSDPQVLLRMSNDGGHTWFGESWESLGKKIGGIGDFKKRVKWERLGSARDRVFEIKVTDPVDVTIIGADLDLVVGAS